MSLALERVLKLKGNVGSKRQHVHSCSLVRAKKFYGYHSSEELFMKIYLYYPQDVTRAATLLLAGAIFDKILQPYESHIPYLLQFLIDYNLYGMGHLHVSKIKFRFPVPDVFSSQKAAPNRRAHDSGCTTENQSGQKGNCSNLPVWIASTIPDGWMWQCLEEFESSQNEDIPLFRRQSTSELEGDAVADEIMNRQFISYAPLSQTHSEVRMVQSLVPIWEEEFERTGFTEAMPSDSGKPIPQDVLGVLSNGIEFVNYVKLKNDGEGVFTPKSIESTARDSPSQDVDVGADEIDIASQSPSSAKASDEDALRLLKWFASSQAAEDINSDDELAHELILSPLLPSKSIDKVLEKANVDYESESQQECQDILDSIDLSNLDGVKGRASNPDECNRTGKASSSKRIPQLDGSSDDPELTPTANNSDKTVNNEPSSFREVHSCPELDSSLTSENTRKRPRMGSLPIVSKTLSNVSHSTTQPNCDGHGNERKGNFRSSLFGNAAERFPRIVKIDEEKDFIDSGQAKIIAECSTRDLMRRKRSHRIEQSEHTSSVVDHKIEFCEDTKCQKRDENLEIKSRNDAHVNVSPVLPLDRLPGAFEEVESHQRNIDCILEPSTETQHFKSSGSHSLASRNSSLSSKDCMVQSQCQGPSYTCKGTDVSAEHSNNMENKPPVLLLNSYHGRDPCSSRPYNSTPEKVIGMTFSRKPPVIGWTDALDGESSPHRKFPDDCPPFFKGSFLEEKELVDASSELSECTGHESLKGIPTLYQNDGSCLYMLTPAVSPPSRECVDEWLLGDNSDLGQNINQEVSVLPISNKDTDGINLSLNCQADDTEPLELASSSEAERCSMEVQTAEEKPSTSCSQDISQISGPDRMMRLTPLSQIGFRDPASAGGGQQLTMLSIEVHAESRADLRPDPRFDAINIIVLVFQEDNKSTVDAHVLLRSGSACVKKDIDAISGCDVLAFTEELDLLNHFRKVIRTTDPDIIMGWDVQSGSLGYLAERAAHLGLGLLSNISRTPSQANEASGDSQKEMGKEIFSESETAEAVLQNAIIEDEWGRTHGSGVHVGGRIVLNIWRLMRNEVKLSMYTAEAVAEAVLRRKIPVIPWKVLSNWFNSGPARARFRTIEYILERANLNLQIMSQLDMINRTSELARVFGIDFFSVLSRGSQYRVESMFLRLAHTQNYLVISPGKHQVANQPAMECIPLVMEPESRFYADPVIVLDFQSLYPSMVIAYNLCFCTCLGKITPPMADILGVTTYKPDVNIFRNLIKDLLVTPNGVAYVPSNVRKGILPRLLEEILSTRIMVKQAMKKLAPSQQVLHRILNARQLALKLIANVTYGYTAAGFSGRMPCAELADSIVQCGRRTLETAISFVNSNDKWQARVIYGDTDSLFVLLKGRSVKEAFAIGREIASAVSEMNPAPVTLKMEKVYYPCFLLTKKRYVGYSYESPDQMKPVFDAKGIETVRRDTCAAVSKTLEKTLTIYFESQDIDKVKAYLQRQWTRILSGRVSLQDFVFAKEVRLGTYSARASSLPPAAIVASKAMRADPRAEPRYAERVPYAVVHGEPGARLADLVVDPLDLLALDSPLRLNDIYYIRKQIIPALQRVFGLVGADLNKLFLEMPRPARKAVGKSHSLVSNPQKTRIDYYYLSKHCIICDELVQSPAHLCQSCCKDQSTVAAALTGRTSKLEKDMHHLTAICRHCGGGDWLIETGVKCVSLACPVFYQRRKVQTELQSLSEVTARTGFYPKCMVEWF